MSTPSFPRDSVSGTLFRVESSDPSGELVDRAGLTPDTIASVNELMTALGELKRSEQALSDASLRYMKLNQTDMRALHYLIVAQNTEQPVTPGALALHLGISTASTTKMLDRLERGGHIVRSPHPSDRRALVITITEDSHRAARETVGRQHAKRFGAAARLSPAERETVTRFLRDMAESLALGEDADWARQPGPPPGGDAEEPR
ncbi:MarR family winged helix-turn-helix transcriptional regulator [Leucobacter sp. M11]|uniref:MarR family winged helix-turn-helix transcriptional regulator n=1 Tax=Leucobacter sp. M11 TaxID=2993565 RepID=UPI002D7E6695|nr:MarR family transcriptional regulator [Leucobacter sp. M11]MEB4615009.1 MarR family transcriptional regulator [Leucobacter sp. M11]